MQPFAHGAFAPAPLFYQQPMVTNSQQAAFHQYGYGIPPHFSQQLSQLPMDSPPTDTQTNVTLSDLKSKLRELEAERQTQEKQKAPAAQKALKLRPHMRILPKKESNGVAFYPVVDPLNRGLRYVMCAHCKGNRLYQQLDGIKRHLRQCQDFLQSCRDNNLAAMNEERNDGHDDLSVNCERETTLPSRLGGQRINAVPESVPRIEKKTTGFNCERKEANQSDVSYPLSPNFAADSFLEPHSPLPRSEIPAKDQPEPITSEMLNPTPAEGWVRRKTFESKDGRRGHPTNATDPTPSLLERSVSRAASHEVITAPHAEWDNIRVTNESLEEVEPNITFSSESVDIPIATHKGVSDVAEQLKLMFGTSPSVPDMSDSLAEQSTGPTLQDLDSWLTNQSQGSRDVQSFPGSFDEKHASQDPCPYMDVEMLCGEISNAFQSSQDLPDEFGNFSFDDIEDLLQSRETQQTELQMCQPLDFTSESPDCNLEARCCEVIRASCYKDDFITAGLVFPGEDKGNGASIIDLDVEHEANKIKKKGGRPSGPKICSSAKKPKSRSICVQTDCSFMIQEESSLKCKQPDRSEATMVVSRQQSSSAIQQPSLTRAKHPRTYRSSLCLLRENIHTQQKLKIFKRRDYPSQFSCDLCHSNDGHETEFVLCEACGLVAHLSCERGPPFTQLPDLDWICSSCSDKGFIFDAAYQPGEIAWIWYSSDLWPCIILYGGLDEDEDDEAEMLYLILYLGSNDLELCYSNVIKEWKDGWKMWIEYSETTRRSNPGKTRGVELALMLQTQDTIDLVDVGNRQSQFQQLLKEREETEHNRKKQKRETQILRSQFKQPAHRKTKRKLKIRMSNLANESVGIDVQNRTKSSTEKTKSISMTTTDSIQCPSLKQTSDSPDIKHASSRASELVSLCRRKTPVLPIIPGSVRMRRILLSRLGDDDLFKDGKSNASIPQSIPKSIVQNTERSQASHDTMILPKPKKRIGLLKRRTSGVENNVQKNDEDPFMCVSPIVGNSRVHIKLVNPILPKRCSSRLSASEDLKRRISEYPNEFVGRRITIRWTSDRSWHSGTVVAYENGHHEILYDSGTSSIVDLVRCQLQFL